MKIYNLTSFKSGKNVDSYAKNAIMVFGNKENVWNGKVQFRCSKYSDTVFIKLNPNEIIPRHKHSNSEEITFIFSGDGFFNYNNRRNKIKKGDLIFFEDNLPHDYIAGEKGLNILVFHSPPMKDRQLVK